MIPYSRQYVPKKDFKLVKNVLNSNFLTQGPIVKKFEKKISEYTNSKYALALNSASSALHVACLALGLRKGDFLWTSSISFVASANCGMYCGASIDLVDIDKNTFNISVNDLKKKLKKAKLKKKLPKILVVVHLGGNPCELKEIKQLSVKYNFKIIEDASHAIGSKYKNSKIGSCKYSDITVFSFHPVKIMTTGEGGVITTNSKELARKSTLFREHGIVRDEKYFISKKKKLETHYEQQVLGFNYRMNEISASLGLGQIKWINRFVHRRNKIHNFYKKSFLSLPVNFQKVNKDCLSSFHLTIILVPKKIRNTLFSELRKKRYLVNIHYIPIFEQPFYKKNFLKKNFVNSMNYYDSAISIPNYYQLSQIHQKRIIKIIKRFLE